MREEVALSLSCAQDNRYLRLREVETLLLGQIAKWGKLQGYPKPV